MDQREINEATAQISKPIKWIIPDSIRTDHATHLLMQQQGSEVVLLFFELQGPVLTGTPEEQLATYKELTSIEAKCVAKLVMSRENVNLVASSFIEVLSRSHTMELDKEGQENANATS